MARGEQEQESDWQKGRQNRRIVDEIKKKRIDEEEDPEEGGVGKVPVSFFLYMKSY
jgi:hypothetical protein